MSVATVLSQPVQTLDSLRAARHGTLDSEGIDLSDHDTPGFWESLGYNNYGDPWREQRYWGD